MKKQPWTQDEMDTAVDTAFRDEVKDALSDALESIKLPDHIKLKLQVHRLEEELKHARHTHDFGGLI